MHFSYDHLNNNQGMAAAFAVVLMGVSGSGKSAKQMLDANPILTSHVHSHVNFTNSTIGEMLAKRMYCSFLDADDYHSQTNKDKMSKGVPLTEEDRKPWLETLRCTLRENIDNGQTVILGCSALQKRYREILRMADSNYVRESYVSRVKFVCLEAPVEVIEARLEKRVKLGNHFMPATLLQSQLDLLQIDSAEGIIMVDATLSPQVIVNNILALII